MNLVIRPAIIHDHDAINHISAEVAALHARDLPDQFREAHHPWSIESLRSLIESNTSEVVIAERDGRIVGHEILHLRDAPEFPVLVPRRFVVIDEIAVAVSEHRQGIGRMLIDAAVRWAREQDASDIELNVYEFNEAAIAFYEHLGFTTLKRTMVRSLGDVQSGGSG